METWSKAACSESCELWNTLAYHCEFADRFRWNYVKCYIIDLHIATRLLLLTLRLWVWSDMIWLAHALPPSEPGHSHSWALVVPFTKIGCSTIFTVGGGVQYPHHWPHIARQSPTLIEYSIWRSKVLTATPLRHFPPPSLSLSAPSIASKVASV